MIVTAYRRRQYLAEAVRSVLAQDVPSTDVELIVVKDFADPELDGWLSKYGERVRIVTEDLPLGEAMARGVALARGEIVCFLDDDDRFRSEKLSRLIALFRSDPGLGFVRNSFDAIDSAGRPLPGFERYRRQPPSTRNLEATRDEAGWIRWIFSFGPHINLSSMAVRASIVRTVEPWLRRIEGGSDAFLFFTALTSTARLRIDAGRWNEYRVHSSSSHAALDEGHEARDLRELRRYVATAQWMNEMLRGRAKSRLATRFLTAFRLEAAASVFVMDPDGRLRFGDWLSFGRTILWRRQRYLLVPWVYCLYRWVYPAGALRSFRAHRLESLRRAAGP